MTDIKTDDSDNKAGETAMNSMQLQEIMQYLPHRYPFLLIDRVVDIKEGDYIIAYKNVSANEAIFNGHFPGNPVFPGVLIVEALAQAASILGFKTSNKGVESGSVHLFAGIDKARFKRQVVPGDRLQLEVSITSQKRNIWKFDCRATVDGELAAQASIISADQPVAK